MRQRLPDARHVLCSARASLRVNAWAAAQPSGALCLLVAGRCLARFPTASAREPRQPPDAEKARKTRARLETELLAFCSVETNAMDDDGALLQASRSRAASAAGPAHCSAGTTSPSSLNSMDQAAMRALPNANLVLAALRSVFGLCQQVRDRPRAGLQAHARLHQAFLRVASAAKHGSLPVNFRLSHYTAVLNQLKAALTQHLRLRDLVARVLASRRLLSGLARVHHDLNALLLDNALASATSSLLEWKQQFAANRQQDERALHDTLMALLSTPTFVHKEFPSERRQALVLLELVAEFASSDPSRGHSPQLLETLKMMHRRISNLCDLHLRRVPRWFLPGCEVDFSITEHAIGHSRGSFGSTLQRGEAYRYSYTSDGALASSSTSTVAVKCLWALPDVQYQFVEQLFARSGVAKWTRVRHPNVVTVRGASHAATPPYLVRDFTTYGGLTAYLAALETRAKQCAGPESSGKMEALTWQLLYGASRGLLHLHEQHSIVHGGLRCNNILVDKKGRAVIADFGLYTLACDARDSGLTEYFQLDVFDADSRVLAGGRGVSRVAPIPVRDGLGARVKRGQRFLDFVRHRRVRVRDVHPRGAHAHSAVGRTRHHEDPHAQGKPESAPSPAKVHLGPGVDAHREDVRGRPAEAEHPQRGVSRAEAPRIRQPRLFSLPHQQLEGPGGAGGRRSRQSGACVECSGRRVTRTQDPQQRESVSR